MKNKKIPAIIGIVLLLIGAGVGVMLIGDDTSFLPRAAPEYVPQKVKISNISENSFTVSWITQEPSIGFIKLGTSSTDLDEAVVDDRDLLSGDSQEYRSHYITAQDLEPNATYYFKLGSQGNKLYDKNGTPFSIKTSQASQVPPPPDSAYGKVLTPASTPAQGAIVYVDVPGATPLSALVKNDGNWVVSLSSARSMDLQSYANYDKSNTQINILAQSSSGDIAIASVTTNNTKPVPDIILGETHDFTLEGVTNAAPPDDGEQDTSDQASLIQYPTQNQNIADSQPTMSGQAPLSTTITLRLEPINYSDEVTTDESGSWQWQIPGTLAEDTTYTIYASYTSDEGILITESSDFSIDLEASANISQITPTTTKSPTPLPSTQPTQAMSPTPTPPNSRAAIPTNNPEIPVAGNAQNTLIILAIGVMMMFTGLVTLKNG